MKQENYKFYEAGSLELEDLILIIDPCHPIQFTTELKIKKGTWYVEFWRNKEMCSPNFLVLRHSSRQERVIPEEEKLGYVGMDSGQVGVYNKSTFRSEEQVDLYRELKIRKGIDYESGCDVWYEYACVEPGLRLDIKQLPDGVTCYSGYGDGTAKIVVDYNRVDEITRIGIDFN